MGIGNFMTSASARNTPIASELPGVQNDTRVSVFPLPLTALEKFLWDCESPNSPMVIRVVLRLRGILNSDELVRCLKVVLARHPLLNCRLTKHRGMAVWVPCSSDESCKQISLTEQSGSVLDSETGPLQCAIDLRNSPAVRVTIRVLPDGAKAIIDGHHAATDGNGLRQLITEWLHLYHCEQTASPHKRSVTDPDRLLIRHRLPQPAAVEPTKPGEALRNFWHSVRGRSARWQPLIRGSSDARDEESFGVEILTSAVQRQLIDERLNHWRIPLNDLLLASSMRAFSSLVPSPRHHRITVLNPTELRRPSDRSLPAANRFGLAFLRRRPEECLDAGILLSSIRDQMTYVRSRYVGADFVHALQGLSKTPWLIRAARAMGWFVPTMQVTCLGDVARGARRLIPIVDGAVCAAELKVLSVTGFAPFADQVPVSIASTETGNSLVLTIRSSRRYLTHEQTHQFADALLMDLCEYPLSRSGAMTVTDGEDTC
jgi:hypothetical protein